MALSTGERVYVAQPVLGVREVQGVQALLDAAARLLGRKPGGSRPEGDVRPYGVLYELRVGLLKNDIDNRPSDKRSEQQARRGL